MERRHTVFFVSDGTGITAEMLGHSLLTQFEGVQFHQVTLPFVNSLERAEDCRARIAAEAERAGVRPIVFSTLVDRAYRGVPEVEPGWRRRKPTVIPLNPWLTSSPGPAICRRPFGV